MGAVFAKLSTMQRSDFIKTFLSAAAGLYFTNCDNATRISYIIKEENSLAAVGHMLQSPLDEIEIKDIFTEDIVIIGAGVSGLSAARWIERNSSRRCCILELAETVGGNSTNGENAISKYPWAAHYLPIPATTDVELINFLKEASVITGFEQNKPIYNEAYLCSEPKERVFENGRWHEGLIPLHRVTRNEQEEVQRFMNHMQKLKTERGEDGKYIFDIPLSKSSKKNAHLQLDTISFYDWLKKENYTSKKLFWYVDYCCKDDFGSDIKNTSAWAGIHYFASRRGEAANAKSGEVLTWPEGNAFLVEKIKEQIKGTIRTNELVMSIKKNGEKMIITHYNSKKKEYYETHCKQLICATPIHVAKKFFPQKFTYDLVQHFSSYPWIIANISIEKMPDQKGFEICWDNLIYNSPTLGYVAATHQNQVLYSQKHVFTVYYPVIKGSVTDSRKWVREKDINFWQNEILDELSKVHSNIKDCISEIVIKKLGHGMITPSINFLWNPVRTQAAQPIDNVIYFAHTDYCGMSIFEEAFHIGNSVAKAVINNETTLHL
jgi:hypothetical protein